MNPRTEQLIRDYLNGLARAARGRLGSAERQELLDRIRATLERAAGEPGEAGPAGVRRLLSGLGRPEAVVAQEEARLARKDRGRQRRSPGRVIAQPGHWLARRAIVHGPVAEVPVQPTVEQLGDAPMTGEIRIDKRPISARQRPGHPLAGDPHRPARTRPGFPSRRPRPDRGESAAGLVSADDEQGQPPPAPSVIETASQSWNWLLSVLAGRSGTAAAGREERSAAAPPDGAASAAGDERGRAAGPDGTAAAQGDDQATGAAPADTAAGRQEGNAAAPPDSAASAAADKRGKAAAPGPTKAAGREGSAAAPPDGKDADSRDGRGRADAAGGAAAAGDAGHATAVPPDGGPAAGREGRSAAAAPDGKAANGRDGRDSHDGQGRAAVPNGRAAATGGDHATGAAPAGAAANGRGGHGATGPSEGRKEGSDREPRVGGSGTGAAGSTRPPRASREEAKPGGGVPAGGPAGTKPGATHPPPGAASQREGAQPKVAQQPAVDPADLTRQPSRGELLISVVRSALGTAVATARASPLEALALLLLGLGGAAFPPIWVAGALIAALSRVWDFRDKWVSLIGTPLLVVVGTAVEILLGGRPGSFSGFAHGALAWAIVLSRIGALLSAGFLGWRLRRGPRPPAVAPFRHPSSAANARSGRS
ncbi:MAG TPA: hypothetical protein VGI64_03220 [Streptosporangiaceae bacterium]